MFNVGIVGNNLYSRIYLNALLTIDNVKVSAICSEINESLEPIAISNNLNAFPNLTTMLESEKLDAVIIASSTTLHEHLTNTALMAGVHVLVDRPIAHTIESGNRMKLQAKLSKRILMVGHVIQFWPEYEVIRNFVLNGNLGKPKAVMASRVSGLLDPDWKTRLLNPQNGLGVLEAHVHDIEYLIGLLGLPIVKSAVGLKTPNGSFVQVFSLLGFNDNCYACVESDYSVPNNFPLTMYLRVVGEEASVIFNFSGILANRSAANRSLILFKDNINPELIELSHIDAYQSMLRHFIECAKEGKEPTWGNVQQGFHALETILEISRIAETVLVKRD